MPLLQMTLLSLLLDVVVDLTSPEYDCDRPSNIKIEVFKTIDDCHQPSNIKTEDFNAIEQCDQPTRELNKPTYNCFNKTPENPTAFKFHSHVKVRRNLNDVVTNEDRQLMQTHGV